MTVFHVTDFLSDDNANVPSQLHSHVVMFKLLETWGFDRDRIHTWKQGSKAALALSLLVVKVIRGSVGVWKCTQKGERTSV